LHDDTLCRRRHDERSRQRGEHFLAKPAALPGRETPWYISPEVRERPSNGDRTSVLLMQILESIGAVTQELLEEKGARPVSVSMLLTGLLPQSEGTRD
jgi:hypothetical protein